jgi:DNA-binding CsgD family transcriptional regulator
MQRLLKLMAELSTLRHDPRRWRHEMLEALMGMVEATAATALIIRWKPETVPQVISRIDAGLKGSLGHSAFLEEFNVAPLQDPLSKTLLAKIYHNGQGTITAARRDVVHDNDWYKSPNVERFRRPAALDDCIVSVQRHEKNSTDEGSLRVLMVFRKWDAPTRFGVRERRLVDILHAGLEWMYHAEATMERVTRATELSPRLRQTLVCLLAGDTERQTAERLSLSIHTVHDYVKALYTHFGVSSRSELVSRWVQSGGTLPPAGHPKT